VVARKQTTQPRKESVVDARGAHTKGERQFQPSSTSRKGGVAEESFWVTAHLLI